MPQHPDRAPDCLVCEHFMVTWDVNFPRACRLFGIRCRNLPSHEVRIHTGLHCPAFRRKAILA